MNLGSVKAELKKKEVWFFFKKYGKKSLNYKADIKIKYQSRSDVKTVTASRQLVFGAD